MPLVTSTEMFKKAYDGGYAIGAFNVNNMEIVQGITEAAKDLNAPLILQVSKGARAYANHTYLIKLVEAAGATVVGAGICVEKAFQPGGDLIREMGVRVESLARIKSMSVEGGVEFC